MDTINIDIARQHAMLYHTVRYTPQNKQSVATMHFSISMYAPANTIGHTGTSGGSAPQPIIAIATCQQANTEYSQAEAKASMHSMHNFG